MRPFGRARFLAPIVLAVLWSASMPAAAAPEGWLTIGQVTGAEFFPD